MEEMTANEEPKIIDIHPLGKWKRVLLYLGDFFLVFIVSLLLFHLAIYPLGRLMVDYEGQMTSLHAAQEKRDSVLYHYELLFPSKEQATTYADFEDNLAYTAKNYIHAMTDSSFEPKYDVFAHYYREIRQDDAAWVSFYARLDEKQGFFDITSTSVSLKQQYKEEFAPAFNPDDTMSAQGQKDYQTFESKIFALGYDALLKDIENNDLTFDGKSYKTEQNFVSTVLSNGRRLVVVCALVTLLFVWMLNHLLLPALNKKRKSLAMMFLRIERVHKKTLETPSIPMAYLYAFYSLAAEAVMVIFIPWGSTNFNELFSLPILFPISLFSLAYIIGSLVTLLFDAYNRTLGDLLCQTHCLSADEFDRLVLERGYKQQ